MPSIDPAQALAEARARHQSGDLPAAEAGYRADHPAVKRACDFLLERQLPDGGWGEEPETCIDICLPTTIEIKLDFNICFVGLTHNVANSVR